MLCKIFLMSKIPIRCSSKKSTLLLKFIKEKYNFTNSAIQNLRVKYPRIVEKSFNELEEISNILQNVMQFTKDDIRKNQKLLSKTPLYLLQKYYYLSEAGFRKITPYDILRFLAITELPIKTLKSQYLLENNENVTENFLKNIPQQFRKFSISSDLYENQDNLPLFKVSENLLNESLSIFFEISKEEMQKILDSCPRIKKKSFRIIFENLSIYYDQLCISKKCLKNNISILNMNPKEVKVLFESNDKLTNSVKEFIQKKPYVLKLGVKKIENTYRFLKGHDISNSSMEKCANIFFLKPENILKRMDVIKQTPKSIFSDHNWQILALITYLKKTIYRLQYVNQNNILIPSFNKLLASEVNFMKYVNDGTDHVKKLDLLTYLSRKFKIPMHKLNTTNFDSEIVPVNLNPNWKFSNIVTMQKNISYFNSIGYTNNVLKKYPVILLYPTELLCQKMNEFSKAISYSNDSLTQLYLIHYFIEKDYHFSGNAILEK